MKEIKIKRAYDGKEYGDGYRVLVDRLWPRGVSKEKAALDEWAKEVTPSEELRKSVHGEKITWEEFEEEYRKELKENNEFKRWKTHMDNVRKRRIVTLVTAAKLHEHGHPYVLRDLLEE